MNILTATFVADILPRFKHGASLEQVAAEMVDLGWNRPTRQGPGEAALDFLRDVPEGYVILSLPGASLWRKVSGVWSLLQDGDSKAVVSTSEALAFCAPFLIVLEPAGE